MAEKFYHKIIVITLIIFLTLILNISSASAKALVVVNYLPKTLFMSLTMQYFGDIVTERTKGEIQFRYYWASSLAGAKEIVPMVSKGAADIGFFSPGYYPSDFPLSSVANVIMLSNHTDTSQNAFKELFNENPKLSAEFEKLNLKPLFACTSDISPIGTNKPITRVEDLKGLRIRIYGLLSTVLKEWGATPIAIPSPEIYQAMQTKMIDGFTSQPIDGLRGQSLHMVTKYVTNVGIGIYNVAHVVMNKTKYESLSPEIKKVFDLSMKDAQNKVNEICENNIRKAMKEVLKQGVKFEIVPEDTMIELHNIGLPAVKKEWTNQVARSGIDKSTAEKLLNRYEELVKKYEPQSKYKNYWDIYKTEFKK